MWEASLVLKWCLACCPSAGAQWNQLFWGIIPVIPSGEKHSEWMHSRSVLTFQYSWLPNLESDTVLLQPCKAVKLWAVVSLRDILWFKGWPPPAWFLVGQGAGRELACTVQLSQQANASKVTTGGLWWLLDRNTQSTAQWNWGQKRKWGGWDRAMYNGINYFLQCDWKEDVNALKQSEHKALLQESGLPGKTIFLYRYHKALLFKEKTNWCGRYHQTNVEKELSRTTFFP